MRLLGKIDCQPATMDLVVSLLLDRPIEEFLVR